MTCSQLCYDLSRELSRPDWCSTFSLSSSYQSKFSSLLALRITRQNDSEASSGLAETEERDCTIKIARTIDCFIAINVNRQSPLFLMSLRKVREVVTKVLTNLLVMEHFEPPISIRHDTASSGLLANDERIAPSGARTRELYALAMADLCKDEERMIRLTGLEAIEGDLRTLVLRMKKIVGLNASVFKDIYCSPGMMVGS